MRRGENIYMERMDVVLFFAGPYSTEDILQRRGLIANQLQLETTSISEGTIRAFCDADLERLFSLYDRIFFHSFLYTEGPRDIHFHYNRRLTSSAGLTKATHLSHQSNPLAWHYDISLSKPLLQSFQSPASGITVNGIVPATQLEAMQLVLEHELCHVIEFITYGNSNCRRQRFRTIAMQLFGHTDVVHTLRGIQKPQTTFSAGDTVCFVWKDTSHCGVIARITKRATVMVPDHRGEYTDRTGRQYRKYYVPLVNLHKCEERLL